MDKCDLIDELTDSTCSTFDEIVAWANILEVEVNYPPTDDQYPDWECELRTEVAEAMIKVGKK